MALTQEVNTKTQTGFSRRGFMVGAAGAACLLALGGTTKAFGSGEDLLRPPGGQDEANFLASCIRCDRCRSACPQNAIGIAHLEDGLLNMRTPKMNFQLGACDFCKDETDGPRCVACCPTDALLEGFNPTEDKLGLAVFDYDECVLYRMGGAYCSKECLYACEYGAIIEDESGLLSVDKDQCNGCGACEYGCPSATYASYTGSGKRGINIEVQEGDR